MSGAVFRRRRQKGEEDEALSIADLMSGLMVVFMFIAIVFLYPLIKAKEDAESERARVRDIVVAFRDVEDRLAAMLEQEFRDDMRRWNAEFDRPTLTIRFRAPEVLFAAGERQLTPVFRRLLSDFLPRYTAILWEFQQDIEEIRIEGHTSSEWSALVTISEAFFRNMALSQDRTRSVLEFWLAQPIETDRQAWLKTTVTANGLSSSRLWLRPDGAEDRELSRRVEFRVATRARERVLRVIGEIEASGQPMP